MQELNAYAPLLPEIVVALGAMALLMLGVFRRADAGRDLPPACWRSVLLVAAGAARRRQRPTPQTLFDGGFVVDAFARFMKLLVLAGAALVLSCRSPIYRASGCLSFEYPVLMLLAVPA